MQKGEKIFFRFSLHNNIISYCNLQHRKDFKYVQFLSFLNSRLVVAFFFLAHLDTGESRSRERSTWLWTEFYGEAFHFSLC